MPSSGALPRLLLAVALVLAAASSAMAQRLSGKIVDLTHPFDGKTVFWPTEDGFALTSEHHGKTPAGFFYSANKFCTAEHGGTHVDAPIHFAEGGQTVDQIPVSRLIGPGILIDVEADAAKDRDYQVSRADFERWEIAYGRIPEEAIVLLRTGFGRRWPDRATYLGTAERGPGAVAKLHFPGLHPEAAEWLATHRSIRAIGLDTASIDHGPSTTFRSHVALLGRGIPAFENLASLEELPAKGFTVIALPMKIAGGSGGPLRAVAVLEE